MDGSFGFLAVDEIQAIITFFAGPGNGSIHPPKINERNADVSPTVNDPLRTNCCPQPLTKSTPAG
jgi:hypothetical protein